MLFVYEKLALAHDALLAVGAQPWPEAGRTATADSVVAAAESMTKEVASALGAGPGSPAPLAGPALAPVAGAPAAGAAATGSTAVLPQPPSGAAGLGTGQPEMSCDCDPCTGSAWPRRPGDDGSADYGGACGCQPAG